MIFLLQHMSGFSSFVKIRNALYSSVVMSLRWSVFFLNGFTFCAIQSTLKCQMKASLTHPISFKFGLIKANAFMRDQWMKQLKGGTCLITLCCSCKTTLWLSLLSVERPSMTQSFVTSSSNNLASNHPTALIRKISLMITNYPKDKLGFTKTR